MRLSRIWGAFFVAVVKKKGAVRNESIKKDGQIMEGSFEEKEVREAFWHTSAHVLAQAVKRLYPETKCAIGPAVENGFYYDFEFGFPFSEE